MIVFSDSPAAAQPVAASSVEVGHNYIAPFKLSMVINPVPPVVIEPVACEWLDLGWGTKGDNVPVRSGKNPRGALIGRDKGDNANKEDTQEKGEQKDGG